MNTKSIMRAAVLPLLIAVAGCQSVVMEDEVSSDHLLKGPYELNLAVNPQAAHPGDRVIVTVEFLNTGNSFLWVPRAREAFLGYQLDGAGGESWSSSCDGIKYIRLGPGAKMRYELPFEAPLLYGDVKVFLGVRRDVSVPLKVKKWDQPLSMVDELLPPSARPRTKSSTASRRGSGDLSLSSSS
jgi:hypothetical protein